MHGDSDQSSQAGIMIIQILAAHVASCCGVMPPCRYRLRALNLQYLVGMYMYITLEQEAAFALASVLVLTVVFDCRALNLLTSAFGGHGRIGVGLCPLLVSVLCGCIIAKVLYVWPYSCTNVFGAGSIFLLLSRAVLLYRNRLPIAMLLPSCPYTRFMGACCSCS